MKSILTIERNDFGFNRRVLKELRNVERCGTKIFTFPRQNIENPLTALEETKIGLVSGKIHET